jgi:hypothetical protein
MAPAAPPRGCFRTSARRPSAAAGWERTARRRLTGRALTGASPPAGTRCCRKR